MSAQAETEVAQHEGAEVRAAPPGDPLFSLHVEGRAGIPLGAATADFEMLSSENGRSSSEPPIRPPLTHAAPNAGGAPPVCVPMISIWVASMMLTRHVPFM